MMETKYKVGDKVVGTERALSHRVGKHGTVHEVRKYGGYRVDWGDSVHFTPEDEIRLAETGTLKELNVQPGDVVRHMNGSLYEIKYDDDGNLRNWSLDGYRWGIPVSQSLQQYSIISRANPTPKTWGEMTDAEKGALLLAAYEGKSVWYFNGSHWYDKPVHSNWYDHICYEVKPEPNRKKCHHCVFAYGERRETEFDVVDGKVDWDTFRII